MTTLRYEGLFEGFASGRKLTQSDGFILPFYDDQDFETYEILGRKVRTRWVETRVNYPQKYDLLSEVLAIIRRWAEPVQYEILLNSQVPSIIRMPSSMLGGDIFVVVDVEMEARRLMEQGRCIIAVREGVIRYGYEQGSNELIIEWFNAPFEAEQMLDNMQREFQGLGFKVTYIGNGP